MKRIVFTLTLIACLSYGTHFEGQQSLTTPELFHGTWRGNTGDFISKYSWRGFGFEYRYLSQPHVGAGVNFGWNTFYQELPNAVYTFETISLRVTSSVT
jgi:outer membrane protein